MSSFSKNLWIVGVALVIYTGLTIAAYSPQLPTVLRYGIASLLPLVLALLAGGVLLYAAWASWHYRNVQSILLLILSFVLCALVAPTWLTMSHNYAQAAWQGMSATPETNVEEFEHPMEAQEMEHEEMVAQPHAMPRPKGSHGPVVTSRRPATKRAKMQNRGVIEIDSADELQSEIDKGNPVVVKYFATWCGPCQQMKPIFHSLADKYGDRITFIEVDSDRLKSNMLHANSLPTFILFDGGQEVGRTEGMMDEDEFDGKLANLAGR